MKQNLILKMVLFSISFTSVRSFALSYKCTTTGSADVAKEFLIHDAKEDTGNGLAKNDKAYIQLDGKRKIFGVTTRRSSEVEYYIEFEAREKKYVVKVRIPTGSEEKPAYVDVMPEGSYDNNLKHWVTCEKLVEKTAEKPKDNNQNFCKLGKMKSMTEVFPLSDDEPTVTEEGDLFVYKFPSGLIVKSKKEEQNVESYTLPPGVVCKK